MLAAALPVPSGSLHRGQLVGSPQRAGMRLTEKGVQECRWLDRGLLRSCLEAARSALCSPAAWVLTPVPQQGQRAVPDHSLGAGQGAVLALGSGERDQRA